MASAKQIEANRRNAAKSTGPRTAVGKARTRLNALRHGLTSSTSAFQRAKMVDAAGLETPDILEVQSALMAIEIERRKVFGKIEEYLERRDMESVQREVRRLTALGRYDRPSYKSFKYLRQ